MHHHLFPNIKAYEKISFQKRRRLFILCVIRHKEEMCIFQYFFVIQFLNRYSLTVQFEIKETAKLLRFSFLIIQTKEVTELKHIAGNKYLYMYIFLKCLKIQEHMYVN